MIFLKLKQLFCFGHPAPPPKECTCNGFLQFKSNFILVLFCNGTQNRPTSKTVPINTKTLRKINHINYFSIHILIYIYTYYFTYIYIYTSGKDSLGLHAIRVELHGRHSSTSFCILLLLHWLRSMYVVSQKNIVFVYVFFYLSKLSTVCIYVSAYLCIYVFMYVFDYSFACSYSPFYPFIYLCVFCRTLNTNTTKNTRAKQTCKS